jgi:TPR repeat protein
MSIVSTSSSENTGKMKRVEANDPAAMCQMGFRRYDEGDYSGAFEYYTKAAGLGYIKAHYQL